MKLLESFFWKLICNILSLSPPCLLPSLSLSPSLFLSLSRIAMHSFTRYIPVNCTDTFHSDNNHNFASVLMSVSTTYRDDQLYHRRGDGRSLGNRTEVDAVRPLFWSPLLAQCTHPQAAVKLAAKGSQLSLSLKNCFWLNQEMPFLVDFLKLGTKLWGTHFAPEYLCCWNML